MIRVAPSFAVPVRKARAPHSVGREAIKPMEEQNETKGHQTSMFRLMFLRYRLPETRVLLDEGLIGWFALGLVPSEKLARCRLSQAARVSELARAHHGWMLPSVYRAGPTTVVPRIAGGRHSSRPRVLVLQGYQRKVPDLERSSDGSE